MLPKLYYEQGTWRRHLVVIKLQVNRNKQGMQHAADIFMQKIFGMTPKDNVWTGYSKQRF